MKKPNIILITMDCVRQDHLSCYGYQNSKTKNIDNIAKQGILFTNTICQAPYTPASHASILTGLNPYNHGIRDMLGFKLSENIETLPSILKKQGYSTAAFIGAVTCGKYYNLDKGFDFFDEDSNLNNSWTWKGLKLGNDWRNSFKKWFKENHNKKPFFIWFHHFFTHDGNQFFPKEYKKFKIENIPYEFKYYDAKILFFDTHFLKLIIEELKEKNLYDNTLIIITSDHGESLGAHNEFNHREFLYDSTLKIPLIIKFPKSTKHKKISKITRSVDIFPTILDLLNIKHNIDGKSLFPLIKKNKLDINSAYSETSYEKKRLKSIRTEKYKLIIENSKPIELYNLQEDPEENNNIIKKQKNIKKKLLDLFNRKYTEKNIKSSPKQKHEKIMEKKLKALGYM